MRGKWSLVLAVVLVPIAAMAERLHPLSGEHIADEQTFRYIVETEPASLDPNRAEDRAGFDIVNDLFEGLMTQDGSGGLLPGVATGFEASAGNTVFTFFLRPNALWSDGSPVTAGDFVYAWRRAVSPGDPSPYNWLFKEMGLLNVAEVMSGTIRPEALGVEAIDDRTLRVTLSRPTPFLPQITTNPATFPVPEWAIAAHGEAWTRPENIVSNGAYTLSVHMPEKVSVRVRNPRYWNDAATVIDEVTAYVLADLEAGLTYFFDGQLDMVPMPFDRFQELARDYPDATVSLPLLCTYYYIFNLAPGAPEALRDVRVRRALSYAVDRRTIVEEVLKGGQIEAYSFTPRSVAGMIPPEGGYGALDQAGRDLLARQFMAAAGYGPSKL